MSGTGLSGKASAENSPVLARHAIQLRVRYGETDQMGTFYNARALDWFECGRTELLRSIALPYAELEVKGLFLPLVEAHLEFLGRARYDDPLQVTTTLTFAGRARLRCQAEILHVTEHRAVVRGYTIHALTDTSGRAIRPPSWLVEHLEQQAKLLKTEVHDSNLSNHS